MRSFWQLESMRIQAGRHTEHRVTDPFATSIKMSNDQYEVSLLWYEWHDPLPTNYDLSKRRLTGLLQQLKLEPQILEEYNSIICAQLKDEIIDMVKDAWRHTLSTPSCCNPQ